MAQNVEQIELDTTSAASTSRENREYVVDMDGALDMTPSPKMSPYLTITRQRQTQQLCACIDERNFHIEG